MTDVAINKVQTVQRSVLRARQEYQAAGADFATDFTRQDAAILNVVRACEATLDLANHLVRLHKLGVPNTSADAIRALANAKLLESALADRLTRMVGFRNIAVHAYQAIDLRILESVIAQGLDDLLAACEVMRRAAEV